MSNVELKTKLLEDIKAQFGDKILSAKINYDMPQVEIDPEIHGEIHKWLKDHPEWQFNHFTDITGVDYLGKRDDSERFEVIVHLHSLSKNIRVRTKTRTGGENPEVQSLINVYIGSTWTEREVYDMYGIKFTDHPRMTRLLNPDDFEGHPLRKDFPVKGLHRGSFPKGVVINNKRREPQVTRQTRPKPADQMLPRTPVEQQRAPLREDGGDA